MARPKGDGAWGSGGGRGGKRLGAVLHLGVHHKSHKLLYHNKPITSVTLPGFVRECHPGAEGYECSLGVWVRA